MLTFVLYSKVERHKCNETPHRGPRDEQHHGGSPSPEHHRLDFRVQLRRRLQRPGHAHRLLPRLQRPQALPLGDSPRHSV